MALKFNRLEYQRKLLDHYLMKGFENDEDLLFYVKEFLGFEYPTKAFCAHHTAPAQVLCDIFFERVLFVLLWANRLGGKTQLVANINHLDSVFKGPIEIVNAGAAVDQADRGYQYYVSSFKNSLLRKLIDGEPLLSKTLLTNGSKTSIITGSKKGFNGPHPEKVRIDEVELMDWDVLQEGLSMSKSTKRARAQDVLSSTRKVSKGVVQRLLDEKDKMRLKVMSYCIWDVVAKCERKCHDDPMYGNCPIWDKCAGKAHEGRGWFPIEDLIQKALSLSKTTFEAQWENKRPSDGPLVYGDYFDREKHVKTWEELYKIFKVDEFNDHRIPKSWTRVAGIDFGSVFVYLVFAIEPRTRTWILFHEYYCNIDRRLKEHSNFIKTSPDFDGVDVIFADAAAKQDRIELKGHGVKTRKSIKGDESILLGIDEVKLHLQNNPVLDRPKFYIVEGVANNTVSEFETWPWKVEKDGRVNTEEPLDSDNHCMDAVRYALFSYARAGLRYEATFVEGA